MATTETPSPARSTATLVAHVTAEDFPPTNVASEQPTTRRSSPSRSRHSPSRLPLRTSFKGLSAIATLIVGDAKSTTRPATQYLVHKELLTSASPFFAAALNGTFAEGLDQVVRLPEEKPEIFEWFLQWLYTGTLTTPTAASFTSMTVAILNRQSTITAQYPGGPDAQTDGDLRNHAGSPKYFLLMDLYALSDRLLTTSLSNHILSTIARLSESSNSVPTPSDTFILFDHIRDSSPLRALILDLFAYKKTDKLLENHKDDWHPRFLRALVVKLKRPGPEWIERHTLVSWRPDTWAASKGCECCRETLSPSVSGERCRLCEKVFCPSCRKRHLDWYPGGLDPSGCKPWSGEGMCQRYHDHSDGDACA